MQRPIWLCLIFLASPLSTGDTHAQQSDRAAILSLTDDIFDAVASRNPDDWRAIQLAEGTTLSFRQHPDGDSGRQQMRLRRNEAAIADMQPDGREFMERWIGEPTVMIRGPIAVVWGDYDFWIDGSFSHCGVDSIDAVNVDGDWKVANIMWTMETDNCPTNPQHENQ